MNTYTLKPNGDGTVSLYRTHYLYNYVLQECSEPVLLETFDHSPSWYEVNQCLQLNDWSRWNHDLYPSQKVEVSERVYYDMLNCLPPRNWLGTYFEVGEAHHHTPEGKPIHRAFWKEGERYYTGYPRQIN